MTQNLRVLVAAAGRGSRSGLPYPKTLYPVQGRPILVRILELVKSIDACPTVVVSPTGKPHVMECLEQHKLSAVLVEQEAPLGMGDAVLRFQQSPWYAEQQSVVLIWGDVPFIQPRTLQETIETHSRLSADFTFPTAIVGRPYTVVDRDALGRVRAVIETRETQKEPPSKGERDIGLFVFRAGPVLKLLKESHPLKQSARTGEHGFLYVIGELVNRGYTVIGLPIATDLELISLNQLTDLGKFA